eukprot:jgi/Undpi1/6027/HiC_scaffold_2.g01301.m1
MALSVKADETALELFRRSNRSPLRTGIAFLDEVPGRRADREKGVGRGDVVELYGPSGCGKSEVLINVVARCVLPAWLGGQEQVAFFFDNDGRLSVLRLEQLLREKITTNTTFQVKTATGGMAGGSSAISGPQQLEREVEAVLLECLRRLRVIRPASLFELLASIEVLRFELEHRPAVVAVDGMGSFFWQDKMAQSCGGEAVSMQGAVVKALVRLAAERPVVIFAAKNALFLPRGGNVETEHREYLPQAWQRAVTFRVVLQRRLKRPPSLRPQSAVGGEGGALSLFTAQVSSPNAGSGGGGGGGGGSFGKGSKVPGRNMSGVGDEEPRAHFFVVMDDGIHDVPAAATMGEGEATGS